MLALAAGLAVLGIYVHYEFTTGYGDVTDEWWRQAFSGGIGGVALGLVGLVALVALVLSSTRRLRLAAVAIPVLMLVGMLAVTPLALQHKLEDSYNATPQCVSTSPEVVGPGPALPAARESQRAFESIEHVGHFGGGGGSGVGGCERPFVLTEEVDVLQHYRTALPEAGWRVVEDDAEHLRAERDGMAFEVVTCDDEYEIGGVVWAGRDSDAGRGCN